MVKILTTLRSLMYQKTVDEVMSRRISFLPNLSSNSVLWRSALSVEACASFAPLLEKRGFARVWDDERSPTPSAEGGRTTITTLPATHRARLPGSIFAYEVLW